MSMNWQSLLLRAERRLDTWEYTLRQRVRSLARLLWHPDFWISLIWMLLAGGMLLGLAWFAIRHYDSFLHLKPLLCAEVLDNQRLLLIVFAAPLSLVFTLVATSEFLILRKRRQRHVWVGAGTGTFWLHTLLMLLAAAALLWAMQC